VPITERLRLVEDSISQLVKNQGEHFGLLLKAIVDGAERMERAIKAYRPKPSKSEFLGRLV